MRISSSPKNEGPVLLENKILLVTLNDLSSFYLILLVHCHWKLKGINTLGVVRSLPKQAPVPELIAICLYEEQIYIAKAFGRIHIIYLQYNAITNRS